VTQQPTAPTAQQPDPYTAAAYEQEQQQLTRAMQIAQAEHLLNRAVVLAADNARLSDRVAELEAQLAAVQGDSDTSPTPGD